MTSIHRIDEARHMHSVGAGVIVPLLQALVTGLLVAIIAALVTAYYKVTDWYFWAAISAALVIFGQWMFSQALWRRIVRLVEREWLVDIDGDGTIGEPEPQQPAQSIQVEVTDKNSGFPRTDFIELPFSEDNITQLAEGLKIGKPFTEREWCGAGKPLSVNQFRKARVEMLRRGLIEQVNAKDARQGYRLTKAGTAVMRHFSPTLSS